MSYTRITPEDLGAFWNAATAGILHLQDGIADADTTAGDAATAARDATTATETIAASVAGVTTDLDTVRRGLADAVATIADLQALVNGIGNGPGGYARGYLLVVPATAPARMKAGADLVLTGTGDVAAVNELTKRAAPLRTFTAASPAGAEQAARVVVAGGRVNVETTLLMRTGVEVSGCGSGTEFRATKLGGAPMVGLASPDEHVWVLKDAWFNGNGEAGGIGHVIDIDQTGSTNAGVGTYPSLSPDADFRIEQLWITGADNGQRAGIKLGATGTANCRGGMVDRVQIRHCWRGVWMTAASDCHLNMIVVGSCSDSGFELAGGNTKGTGLQAYYCATGFRLTGGRSTYGTLGAQDCETGFDFRTGDVTAVGLLADSCRDTGIRIGANRLDLRGVRVLFRTGSGVRWPAGATAILIDGTYTDITLEGSVAMTNIGTKMTGTPGTSWLVRLHGGGLTSVG